MAGVVFVWYCTIFRGLSSFYLFMWSNDGYPERHSTLLWIRVHKEMNFVIHEPTMIFLRNSTQPHSISFDLLFQVFHMPEIYSLNSTIGKYFNINSYFILFILQLNFNKDDVIKCKLRMHEILLRYSK